MKYINEKVRIENIFLIWVMFLWRITKFEKENEKGKKGLNGDLHEMGGEN